MSNNDYWWGILTEEQHYKFRDTLSDIYNQCGPDLGWVDKAPEVDEFVDVLIDLLASSGLDTLTNKEINVWRGLTIAQKRALCLEIGP